MHADVYLLQTTPKRGLVMSSLTHLHPPKDNLIGNYKSVDRDLLQQRHTHTHTHTHNFPNITSRHNQPPQPWKTSTGKNIVIDGWPNGLPQELPNTIFIIIIMIKLATITKPLS